jgi:hypothetical protein
MAYLVRVTWSDWKYAECNLCSDENAADNTLALLYLAESHNNCTALPDGSLLKSVRCVVMVVNGSNQINSPPQSVTIILLLSKCS